MKPNRFHPISDLVISFIFTWMLAPSTTLAAEWTWRNPLPHGGTIEALTWTGTQVVALGHDGKLLTSPDGLAWSHPVSLNDSIVFKDVVWTGSMLVGVGYNALAAGDVGAVFTSSDGVSWTRRTLGVLTRLNEIAWSGSVLVGVGSAGGIFTSTDGIDWTSRTSGTSNILNAVEWVDSLFVAAGASGTLLTSPDGITWTARSSGTSVYALTTVAHNDEVIVAMSTQTVHTSTDGVTWTSQPLTTASGTKMVWTGTRFVAVGSLVTRTSPNGSNWTSATGTGLSTLGVTWTGTRLVATGTSGTIVVSSDGDSWTSARSGFTGALNDIIWDGGRFLTIGSGAGSVMASPDGETWTTLSPGSLPTFNDIVWTGTQYVAVGSSSTVRTSPDGVSWTARTAGSGLVFNGVAASPTRLVAVGSNARAVSADDGVTWTTQTGTGAFLSAVVWADTQFVAVGTANAVRRSSDGVTWTSSTLSGTWNGIAWNGSVLVAVGNGGAIRTSPDGITWTTRTSGTTGALNDVTWDGSAFRATGAGGVIVTSTDGTVWSLDNTRTTTALTGIAHGGGRTVVVATGGTILSSGGFATTPPAISYAQPAPYRRGAAIAALVPQNAGGGATWSVTPALPAGLSLGAASGIVTGTPTVTSAAATYSLTATNAAGSDVAALTLAVHAVPGAPTGVTALGGSQKAYVDWTAPSDEGTSPITAYTVTAAPGGATCTLTMPTSGPLTCTVTGLTDDSSYTFTVTAASAVGAGAASEPTAAVTPGPSPQIGYSGSPYTFAMGTEVNQPAVNPAPRGTAWTISPSLTTNTGLILNSYTGRILGTPVYLAGATTYRIQAIDTLTGRGDRITLTVSTAAVAPAITYASPHTFTMSEDITPIAPQSTGGLITQWSITPDLTANTGLLFNPTTGKIFGTPTRTSVATTYTVTAHGHGGTQGQASLSIVVTGVPPTVTYDAGPHVLPVNEPMTPLAKTGASGSITSYAITPALPAGLQFNRTTGRISGTPVVASPAREYVVTVTGPGGSGQDTLTLSTFATPPTVGYPNDSLAFAVGSAILPVTRTAVTGIVTRYSITPAPPNGLQFNTTTGRLTGTPTAVSPATAYVITAHGPGGVGSDTVVLATSTPPPTVTYADAPVVYDLGVDITPLVKTAASGLISRYAIAPSLPPGLTLNPTTGTIYGRPSGPSAATDYVVSAIGPGGTGRDTITLAVTTPAPTVTYDDAPFVFQLGVEGQTIAKTAATGTITHYSLTPALPAGLLFNATTGRIFGTPTAVSAATAYTITAHGPGGTGSDQITLAAETPAPTITYDEGPHVYTVGAQIVPPARLEKSGIISHYAVSPSLPAGLHINPTNGRLFGTPAALSPSTLYTITAYGPGGTGSDGVLIEVGHPLGKLTVGREAAESVRLDAERVAHEGFGFTLPQLDQKVQGVTLTLLDLRGRILWIGRWERGVNTEDRVIRWDGRDRTGRLITSGQYLARYAATGKP